MQKHRCWVHDTAALIRYCREQGWQGGGNVVDIQYLWSPEVALTGLRPNPIASVNTEANNSQREV